MTEGSKAGFCKVCKWSSARELNKRANQHNWTATEAIAWAETKGFTFNRKTWYTHRTHSVHPADAIVTFAERSALVAAPTVTTPQFLEAIRDIGYQNAINDPSGVNLNHALKAADLLERRKDQSTDLLAAMAKMMLGARVEHVVTIEGTAREVSP